MSARASSAASPTSAHLFSPHSALSYTPHSNAQIPLAAHGASWAAQTLPLPPHALSAEADAPLNLGLDEEEVVWEGASVGMGFGLLSRLKDKTNAILEAIDWDCRICGKTATDPCVTRCGHLFCWSHLTKHLANVPLCPKCTAPLAMDRDVVQVFGRPKAIPSDAPWTSVTHTPGSTGSAAADQVSVVGSDEPAAPSPRPRSAGSNSSSNSKLYSRRRGLRPLTNIVNGRSGSYEHLDQGFAPALNVFVTGASSEAASRASPAHVQEAEDDPWGPWRRGSDATTVVPHTTSPRTHNDENLRPPSPKLRTKSFMPGWASRQPDTRRNDRITASSSFDGHARQSVEVKFTRGKQSLDHAAVEYRQRSSKAGDDSDHEVEENVIYLDSPTSRRASLAPEEGFAPHIYSPMPKYGYARSPAKLEQAVASPISPTTTSSITATTISNPDEETDFKSAGRKWFAEHRRRTGLSLDTASPTTTTFNPTEIVAAEDFRNLKVAIRSAQRKAKEEVSAVDEAQLQTKQAEEKEGKTGVLGDPLGRALCVFAVVLLVKVLLK